MAVLYIQPVEQYPLTVTVSVPKASVMSAERVAVHVPPTGIGLDRIQVTVFPITMGTSPPEPLFATIFMRLSLSTSTTSTFSAW